MPQPPPLLKNGIHTSQEALQSSLSHHKLLQPTQCQRRTFILGKLTCANMEIPTPLVVLGPTECGELTPAHPRFPGNGCIRMRAEEKDTMALSSLPSIQVPVHILDHCVALFTCSMEYLIFMALHVVPRMSTQQNINSVL